MSDGVITKSTPTRSSEAAARTIDMLDRLFGRERDFAVRLWNGTILPPDGGASQFTLTSFRTANCSRSPIRSMWQNGPALKSAMRRACGSTTPARYNSGCSVSSTGRMRPSGLVGEGKYRTWRLYLAGSINGFVTGRISVFQALLAKADAGQVNLPWSRADLYH